MSGSANRTGITLIALAFSLVGWIPHALCETRVTLLHTSDIHSHFDNHDSPYGLGGLARLKTKIDEVRKENQNNLLLDSGDWSEGSIFFTLKSGEPSHHLMQVLGFDAMALGNHDWLVGPDQMVKQFQEAQFNIPILSANINDTAVANRIPLNRYVLPHVVKTVGGKRIGIIGLSTFQLVYDKYFKPVEIKFPLGVAISEVKLLRSKLKCDAVVVLSHMGITFDRALATAVPGIDLILGGHNHVVLRQLEYHGKTPVDHIGSWGQYLSQMDLVFQDDGRVAVESRKLHMIDSSIPEDGLVKAMVEGYKLDLVKQWGRIFDDQIAYSQVNLSAHAISSESILGDWVTDAIREVGNADVAFAHATYTARDLYPGQLNSVDIFNAFPFIINHQTGKTWTIKIFELPGYALQLLTNGFAKFGGGFDVSNAHLVLDHNALLMPVKSFEIEGKEINSGQVYRVAGNDGIVEAFRFVQEHLKLNLGLNVVKDTGYETWRAIREKLSELSPITAEKAIWQGRVRSVQPDIYVPVEQVKVGRDQSGGIWGSFQLINTGLTSCPFPRVRVVLDLNREDPFGDKVVEMEVDYSKAQVLAGGEGPTLNFYSPKGLRLIPGTYRVLVIADGLPGEHDLKNNKADAIVEVP